MGKIFDLDSPLVRFLNKVADLLWLNILTILCCIPIITAGAAFTALHYCCLKLVRGEEGYITKDFFKSFKLNFKQSTIIWLIVLLTGAILAFDFYIISPHIVVNMQNGNIEEAVVEVVGNTENSSMNGIVRIGLLIATVLYLFTVSFVFPLQSHFYNPIRHTFRNAFMMSITVLPKTVLIVVIGALPLILTYAAIMLETGALMGLAVLFWFSVPAYLSALLYNKTFKKYEPEEENTASGDEWSLGTDDTTDADNGDESETTDNADDKDRKDTSDDDSSKDTE